jgi:hypothetical protein
LTWKTKVTKSMRTIGWRRKSRLGLPIRDCLG